MTDSTPEQADVLPPGEDRPTNRPRRSAARRTARGTARRGPADTRPASRRPDHARPAGPRPADTGRERDGREPDGREYDGGVWSYRQDDNGKERRYRGQVITVGGRESADLHTAQVDAVTALLRWAAEHDRTAPTNRATQQATEQAADRAAEGRTS